MKWLDNFRIDKQNTLVCFGLVCLSRMLFIYSCTLIRVVRFVMQVVAFLCWFIVARNNIFRSFLHGRNNGNFAKGKNVAILQVRKNWSGMTAIHSTAIEWIRFYCSWTYCHFVSRSQFEVQQWQHRITGIQILQTNKSQQKKRCPSNPHKLSIKEYLYSVLSQLMIFLWLEMINIII